MKSATKTKLMIVVAITLCAASAILTVVGIVTHSEPGFIEDAPEWEVEDFPLLVSWGTYGESPGLEDDRNTVREAVSSVNSRMGFEVFQVTDDPRIQASIRVVMSSPVEPGWRDNGGHSQIAHRGGRADRCEVQTQGLPSLSLLWLVLQHELGHCLGLAHDDFESSIMTGGGLRDYGIGDTPPTFTDYDRRIVRERYLSR